MAQTSAGFWGCWECYSAIFWTTLAVTFSSYHMNCAGQQVIMDVASVAWLGSFSLHHRHLGFPAYQTTPVVSTGHCGCCEPLSSPHHCVQVSSTYNYALVNSQLRMLQSNKVPASFVFTFHTCKKYRTTGQIWQH